jgi:uncharacterized protein (DUF1499 family)
MKRPLLAGLAVAAAGVAGGIASAVLGSRPDGVGSDGPRAPCGPSLNCFRSRRPLALAPEQALDTAESVLRGWSDRTGRAISVERTAEGLRAVVQFGPFRDDVTLAVEARGDEASMVYVRSASRLGGSDLGLNRLRGLRLLDAVEAAVDAA